MYLQLAENDFPYKFVPLRDGGGIFVHDDKLSELLSKRGKKKEKKGKVKKVLLSPGRNAFLGIVKLNAFGLATKLAKAIEKNEAGVKKHWEKSLGGNFNKLKTAVSIGSKKKALADDGFQPLALEPATTAAAATAAPVIVSILKWIKENVPQIADTVSDVIDNLPKITGEKNPPDPADPAHADKYEKDEKETGSGFFGIPTPILIGGGLLAAYLLLKKK
jgi:hypothetical protein